MRTSGTSHTWHCGSYELRLNRPLVMGIVNVTPDSFSDGGEHDDAASAIAHGRLLAEQGADVLDVGGESTRPGARELAVAEELARVLPVVRGLASQGLVVSVDTRHVEVAQACVEAGASIVNDVSGFRDPRMVELAASCDAGLVAMHMQGEPGHMQDLPHYDDVVGEVEAYLVGQARVLEGAGVASGRICIDPGIGFGKTYAHNLALLQATPRLASLGWPLLVGLSRKRFIDEMRGSVAAHPHDRDLESALLGAWTCARGASVLRAHNVALTVRALQVLAQPKDA